MTANFVRLVLKKKRLDKKKTYHICIYKVSFQCEIYASFFFSYTNLACLPSTDAVVGDSCVITGWGTLASGGNQPDKLQVATVPVVRQSTCEKAYKKYGIHESMICAGLPEGGVDSCQGDSGGPMVCEDASGLYSLHGVTSWGIGCADKGKYGVYARVKYLLTWINKQISSN